MKKLAFLIAGLSMISLFAASDGIAGDDVYVSGYYRLDGTWVKSHYRSAPNSTKSDNYGPSEKVYEHWAPSTRDNDNDGIPNHMDYDDDNDNLLDDYDDNQYGKSDW